MVNFKLFEKISEQLSLVPIGIDTLTSYYFKTNTSYACCPNVDCWSICLGFLFFRVLVQQFFYNRVSNFFFPEVEKSWNLI